jgi:hypothetical protein
MFQRPRWAQEEKQMEREAKDIRKGDRIKFEGRWWHVKFDAIPPGPTTGDGAWTVMLSSRANTKSGDLVWIRDGASVEVKP